MSKPLILRMRSKRLYKNDENESKSMWMSSTRTDVVVEVDEKKNIDKDAIVDLYLQRLHGHAVTEEREYEVWWSQDEVELHCLGIESDDKDKLPVGFACCTPKSDREKGADLQYRYNLRSFGLGRPKAYRIPFLNSDHFDDSVGYTVSHLCHNPRCYDPKHITCSKLWKITKEGMDAPQANIVNTRSSAKCRDRITKARRRSSAITLL